MADVAGEKAYLLTEKVNPFLYKVWFLADVLDAVEELKLSARKGFAGLMVNTSSKHRVMKYAGFEALVNRYVDIENLILELGEPYSTVILKRLFLETDLFVVKHLGLDNKEQARKLIKTAVNRAYTKICKYLERAE